MTRRDLLRQGVLFRGALVVAGNTLVGHTLEEPAEMFEFPVVDDLIEKEEISCIDENIALSGTVRGVLKEDIDCDSFPATPGPILSATITATGVGEETGTKYQYIQKGLISVP